MRSPYYTKYINIFYRVLVDLMEFEEMMVFQEEQVIQVLKEIKDHVVNQAEMGSPV